MEQLSNILSRLHLRGPGPLQLQRIRDAAVEALGSAAARDIRVGAFRRGRLTLEVASAAQAFEWNAFHGAVMRDALRGVPGFEKLREVRFRVGSWREDVNE